MGKAPAFQFYIRDWLADPELQSASSASRGIWINALCYMWEARERGKLEGSIQELAALLRASNGDFEHFLEDAKKHKFADVTICNNDVTLINRRMWREQKERENTRLRVARHRSNAQSNANVTPLSSTSSSTAKKKKYIKKRKLSDEEWVQEIRKLFYWVDWEAVNREMDAWLLNHPGKQKTRQFIANWLINKQKDKPVKTEQLRPKLKPEEDKGPEWLETALKKGWKV